MANAVETYQDLIKEAFINPIRNVTVIDDDYPTLKTLLKNPTHAADISDNNLDRLVKISDMCHRTHNWSLDVFDGKPPQIGETDDIPEHLSHSDLLILDYHLDGQPPEDDGTRARRILEKLDSNNHYNIILVHTNGTDGDIKEVYTDILFDLHSIQEPEQLKIDDETLETISNWLDENEDGSEFAWLNADLQYNSTDLLKLLEDEDSLLKHRAPAHIFHHASEDIIAISKAIDIDEKDLIKWRLSEICKHQNIPFKDSSRKDLTWHYSDESANYIATGKVFISVIRKTSEDPEAELYEALCNALNKYNASPMHLLMAKIRYEIDDRGFEQAQSIISNREAQAGWLFTLLDNHSKSRAHDKAIDLHWEQLGRASKNSLRAFSQKIVNALSEKGSPKDVVKGFFNECIGKLEDSCGHLNAFTCSMPVIGNHLSTGSILSFNNEYWVCLTPACDLVPDQKAKSWEDRIGLDHLPFKALKLHNDNLQLRTVNKKANSNEYIYLNLEHSNQLEVFSVFNGESPTWDTFYAANQGRFGEDNNIELAQVRSDKGELVIKKIEAVKVVAELRYEYALNLLQRLGANQTRVGLDFINKDSLWS